MRLALRGAGVGTPSTWSPQRAPTSTARDWQAILGSGEVDALLVIYVSPLVSRPEDIEEAVVRAAARSKAMPTAACFLGARPRPRTAARRRCRPIRPVPAFSYPESAANALARAAQLAEWRRAPAAAAPVFEDLDTEGARSIVRNWLADEPARRLARRRNGIGLARVLRRTRS